MDLWMLYALMKKSRLFEEAVAQLWQRGLISGEMHLGTGEEAIIAGIVSQLMPGDAMAVDHRGTAAFLMRGIDPVALLREMLGREDGLCGGRGGHMHLYSKEHLAASSGIVGAAGPRAVGFALAAQYLRPASVAIAFFGEGAMNQGMLLESLNLAAVWNLPVIFVCKDDGWAIITQPQEAARGDMGERVHGLGVNYVAVDGLDVDAVWSAGSQAIERARTGGGPTFLHNRCVHLEGHFLGYELLRVTRRPFQELPKLTVPVLRSFLRKGGGSLKERLAGMKMILSKLWSTMRDPREDENNDPIIRLRQRLMVDPGRLNEVDQNALTEISAVLSAALVEVTR
ncbi:MAG: thiamine pyrophosphate-dependent dehydrogenase E1 component subunit alpha [Brevefilum sp.]|nr:thiamine pyrophosphate-dependent dehydrogenase E1 component subunit alpha [Brevefilum sp.]